MTLDEFINNTINKLTSINLGYNLKNIKYGASYNNYELESFFQCIEINTPSNINVGNIFIFKSFTDNYNWKTRFNEIKLLKPINIAMNINYEYFKLVCDKIPNNTNYSCSKHRNKKILKPFVKYSDGYFHFCDKNGNITQDIIDNITKIIDTLKYSIKAKETVDKNEFSNSFFETCIITDIISLKDNLLYDFEIDNDIGLKFYDDGRYRYLSGKLYLYHTNLPLTIIVDPEISFSKININDITRSKIRVSIEFTNYLYRHTKKSDIVYGNLLYADFINFVESVHSVSHIYNLSDRLNYWFSNTEIYTDMKYTQSGIIYKGNDKYGFKTDYNRIDNHELTSVIDIISNDITDLSDDINQLRIKINQIITLFMNLKINNTIS